MLIKKFIGVILRGWKNTLFSVWTITGNAEQICVAKTRYLL